MSKPETIKCLIILVKNTGCNYFFKDNNDGEESKALQRCCNYKDAFDNCLNTD
ncbi:MAG: hypothetical protein JWR61_706 [Ferruginibacter sp.]|nr:hypothetical protein [Ferruginibacter sp.]